MQGRMLPHSAEAEQSILGCAMIDDMAATYMLEHMTEEMFYSKANRIVFHAMNEIKIGRSMIDLVTLVDALEKSGELAEVGGLQYLNTLSNFVPHAVNYKSYVEIVRNKFVLRSLVRTCSTAIEGAFRNEDAAELLNATEKDIYDVAKAQEKGQLTPIAQVLPDVIKRLHDLEDPNNFKGIPTGFIGINNVIKGLQRGDLVIIAARPSVGKTAFAMNIVTNIATSEGEIRNNVRRKYVCAVFSLEMTREQLVQRMISQVSCVPLERINAGKMTPEDWRSVTNARAVLAASKIFIDDTSMIKPIQIMEKCLRLRNQYGLDCVMIDYLGLITANKDNSESRQNEVAETARYLKVMAKELNVPVLLLSQLSRKVENRPDKTPILSDLRESGAIEQDADIVMFIHREKNVDNPTDKADIIIAKHRNGALARVPVKWKGEIVRFVDDDTQASVRKEQSMVVPPASHYEEEDGATEQNEVLAQYESKGDDPFADDNADDNAADNGATDDGEPLADGFAMPESLVPDAEDGYGSQEEQEDGFEPQEPQEDESDDGEEKPVSNNDELLGDMF